MNKPNARELLKECRGALLRGQADEQMAMVAGIDAYLAAPSDAAMEMVRKIRENDDEIGFFHLTDSDAAALIEGYGRRVPRAMLEEIWDEAYWCNANDDYKSIDEIAAKYGVVIE